MKTPNWILIGKKSNLWWFYHYKRLSTFIFNRGGTLSGKKYCLLTLLTVIKFKVIIKFKPHISITAKIHQLWYLLVVKKKLFRLNTFFWISYLQINWWGYLYMIRSLKFNEEALQQRSGEGFDPLTTGCLHNMTTTEGLNHYSQWKRAMGEQEREGERE